MVCGARSPVQKQRSYSTSDRIPLITIAKFLFKPFPRNSHERTRNNITTIGAKGLPDTGSFREYRFDFGAASVMVTVMVYVHVHPRTASTSLLRKFNMHEHFATMWNRYRFGSYRVRIEIGTRPAIVRNGRNEDLLREIPWFSSLFFGKWLPRTPAFTWPLEK